MKARNCPNDETCIPFMDDTVNGASIQVDCHLEWTKIIKKLVKKEIWFINSRCIQWVYPKNPTMQSWQVKITYTLKRTTLQNEDIFLLTVTDSSGTWTKSEIQYIL